jgi:hypothetical protein
MTDSVSKGDWLLLAAVAIVGIVAGNVVTPALYLATPLALFVVYRGAVRNAGATETMDLYPHPALPARARRAVEEAAAVLRAGEARTLLTGVVTQAILLFQAHATLATDDSADGEALGNVAELVESSCTISAQLDLLDAATTGAKADAATAAARDRFTTSLASAATVIRNLHLTLVKGGTAASDRATELAATLRDDADARSQAVAELSALLKRHSGEVRRRD